MVGSPWFGSVVGTVGGGVFGHDIEHAVDEVIHEPDQVFHLPTLFGSHGGVTGQESVEGVPLRLQVGDINGNADDAAFRCGLVNADVVGGVLHGSSLAHGEWRSSPHSPFFASFLVDQMGHIFPRFVLRHVGGDADHRLQFPFIHSVVHREVGVLLTLVRVGMNKVQVGVLTNESMNDG